MDYQILGPIEVRSGGARVYIGGPREHRSLVALLLNAGRTVDKARLVEVLWGEAPPRTADSQIRNTIASLRRHLGVAVGGVAPIARAGAGFVAHVAEGQLDAWRFREHGRQARSLVAQGRFAQAVEALRSGLRLWRGPALAGLGAPVLDGEARALEEERLAWLERRIELELALGRHLDLIGELESLVREHPLREHLVELQIIALYQAGRRQEALAAYAAARTRLTEQAGLSPRAELRRLQQAILQDKVDVPALAGLAIDPSIRALEQVARVTPAQLPLGVAGFTGRGRELELLDSALCGPGDPAAVPVAAVSGTAGVGKSTLAVHWGHRVASRFPDGQLFVNLHGYGPSVRPREPSGVLRGFLTALGVQPHSIPADLPEQISLYRSVIAGRRVLIVLDNARDAAQVRPFLPGTPGCAVVVTSRDRLSGLVAAEGARPVVVNPLTTGEANTLLATRIGARRTAAEPEAVCELLNASAGLPLALAAISARAAIHPGLPLAVLAADICGRWGGLGPPHGGDPAMDLRAAFSWSYRLLESDVSHIFRLMGLVPGPHLSVTAAASLAGVEPARMRSTLARLGEAFLIVEGPAGRYAHHALLHAYARELAHLHDDETQRRAAVRRLLDYYLHSAYAAALLVSPERNHLTLEPPADGVVPDCVDSRVEALQWFQAEHANLVAAATHATETGFHSHAWQIGWTLSAYLDHRGQWQDVIGGDHTTVAIAPRLADTPARARAHRGLASVSIQLGRDDRTPTCLCDDLGDRRDAVAS